MCNLKVLSPRSDATTPALKMETKNWDEGRGRRGCFNLRVDSRPTRTTPQTNINRWDQSSSVLDIRYQRECGTIICADL